MKMFEEFLDIHRAFKRDRVRLSKTRKPNIPRYDEMPRIQLEVAKVISKITGIDPYEIQDLIREGDWGNPIVHQPILDLFMGLRLTYQGEKSYERRRSEEIRKENRDKKLKYEQKLADYQESIEQRKRPTDSKLVDWFKDTREMIADKITNEKKLTLEDRLIVQAIASEFNQMVLIDDMYQPEIIRDMSPGTDDTIRIMRKARKLYSETPADLRS